MVLVIFAEIIHKFPELALMLDVKVRRWVNVYRYFFYDSHPTGHITGFFIPFLPKPSQGGVGSKRNLEDQNMRISESLNIFYRYIPF